MADKKTVLVVFGYSDGSYDYAVGDHAKEVSDFLNGCQSMAFVHGGEYRGRIMEIVPAPDDLEPIKPIAERTFPEWVAELAKVRQDE